jgi:hypothetical protein
MRSTYVILFIAIMVLVGCKPKSKSALDIKTDSSKSTSNMPDIGDLKNNSTNSTSGSGSWSKKFRNDFLQLCIGKASEKVSAAEAFSYCNCMTEKVELKYPDEKVVDASLTNADIESMRVGCVSTTSTQTNPSYNQQNSSASWSSSDQKEFMDNCTPGASKSMGTSGAYNYCDCAMKKLMQSYPNSADLANASETQLRALTADCLRR